MVEKKTGLILPWARVPQNQVESRRRQSRLKQLFKKVLTLPLETYRATYMVEERVLPCRQRHHGCRKGASFAVGTLPDPIGVPNATIRAPQSV